MKRCLLACLGLGLSFGVYAANEADAWLALQKAAVAAHALSYKGIFSFQAGPQSTTIEITHYFDGQNEFSRNISLEGKPREVLSQDGEAMIYKQKREKVVIARQRGQNMFPAILPTNIEAIKLGYNLNADTIERVAGREATLYHLLPKDNLRYRYNLWIDNEYGLLLKSQLINDRNEPLEQAAFMQINLMQTVRLDWFQPKIDSSKNYEMEAQASRAIADNQESAEWTLKEIPAGFKKIEQVKRIVLGKLKPVTHILFSDGLSSVSLFIEPATSRMQGKRVQKTVGNTHFYASCADRYQVTVVGDVPENTILLFANAVEFNK